MLRLTQQIGGNHLHIGRVVGDYQNLRRPGQQIDAHAPEQLAFGFGHIRIARTYQHVHCRHALRAYAHRRYRLHAAQHVNVVRARQHHRGYGFSVRHALVGRRACDHAAYARGARGDDAHVRGRHHRVTTAGYITPHAVHRNILVPQLHAGQCFDFNVLQRGALMLGEIAYLRLCELDVVEGRLRHFRHNAIEFRLRQLEARRRPFVELLRQFPHRVVPALLDVSEYGFDGLPYFQIDGIGDFLRDALFKKLRHGAPW